VLLACSHALLAGVGEARDALYETFALMERHLWQPEFGLYADEADAHWHRTDYRGQNAYMHATEACLAAFEATRDERFLDRVTLLADHIVQRQTAQTDGLMIWEHYRADRSIDWDYNRHDSSDIFRPWGYQPRHFTKWAKLLLILERHRPLLWLLRRA
jgi:mannose/cellobiose epimerase-like protein (N-acyl-D-glucosamine 2-epimerase family)